MDNSPKIIDSLKELPQEYKPNIAEQKQVKEEVTMAGQSKPAPIKPITAEGLKGIGSKLSSMPIKPAPEK